MSRLFALAVCCASPLGLTPAALAQTAQNQGQAAPATPSYATLAPLVLAAPLIVDARIRNADRVKPADAPGLAAGRTRFYVEADVSALIRGANALPSRIFFLADVPLDWRGRVPKLRKQRMLIFARPLAGRADHVQLIGADAQLAWTPEADALVRGITREALAPGAPPAITGLGNAFHVPGTLPGEGETQIFLTTRDNSQISLQILRRPGLAPTWSVSTGDFIDESAGAPQKDTLLWYRLACGLPRQLPATSLESDDPANARVAREDYQTVLRDLGPCA